MRVVGVDGCQGGWIAVTFDIDEKSLTPARHPDFSDVVASYRDAACIAVDIPIGLTTLGARRCDLEARKALTRLRGSSVFPAPDRRIVGAESYDEATLLSRKLTGNGVSVQAFGIFAKVEEVDRLMTPELQLRIVEVHPEVCFWALAGRRPLEHAKKRSEGFDERRSLLRSVLDAPIPTRRDARRWAHGAAPDDALDAIAAAWSARRFSEGIADRLPQCPVIDERGLRMEIVY